MNKIANAASRIGISLLLIAQQTLPGSVPALAQAEESAADPHAYFNWLAARPETILARSYRDNTEIEADRHGPWDPARNFYDPVEDAAKATILENSTNVKQVRPAFPTINSGRVLFTWDARWPGDWQEKRESMHTHKAFQLAENGHITIEVRLSYRKGTPPQIGSVNIRLYGQAAGGTQPLEPQINEFIVEPDTWTRFWALVEFNASGDPTYPHSISLWVADETRPPVQTHDRVPVNWSEPELTEFWFEYNSSQSRTGPEMWVWYRNLAILKDAADPEGIIAQGAQINGGASADPANSPPSVNAGADQTITLPASASLDGTVSDDGLPDPPGALATAWTQVSGPGTVAFGDPAQVDTTASFPVEGAYVLRLTASDGALSRSDDVEVTVNASAAGGTAATYYVSVSGSDANTGEDSRAPRRTVPSGLQPGDQVLFKRGDLFDEVLALDSVSGTAGEPITFGAYGSGDAPTFLRGDFRGVSWLDFEDLAFDLRFGDRDLVILQDASDVSFRRVEARNGVRDGFDIARADRVLLDRVHVHHVLAGSTAAQADAHAVVGSDVRDLTIRGSDLHHFSGDGLQVDPNRAGDNGGGWSDRILVEDTRIWTGPLEADAAGFKAGEVPGENAFDSKVTTAGDGGGAVRMNVAFRGVEAFGFVPGYIANRAAFNLKEKIDALLDRVRVHDSEIAFRVRGTRGNADATIMNSVVSDVGKAVRAEDDLKNLRVFNVTFGGGIGTLLEHAGGSGTGTWDWRNNAFVGAKPAEAAHASNVVVELADFSDPGSRDYHLASGSFLRDVGADLSAEGVVADLDGDARPIGAGYDVGADESGDSGGSANSPPSVSAGADQTITLPASASLDGTVSDDGLPDPPGAVTTTWTKVSGPGTVTFGDAGAEDTSASFSEDGTYVLKLTASDGALSRSDDLQITVNAPAASPAPGDLPTGTLAALPFDGGSLSDVSGNGHHGITNGATPTAQGQYDQAYGFDGIDDYIDLGTWGVDGDKLTLAAWVYPDGSGKDPRAIAKTNGTSADQHSWALLVNGSGAAAFRLNTSNGYSQLTASNIPQGRWTHLAGVYDGGAMRLYVDGQEAGSQAKTGSLLNDPAMPVWIGANPLKPADRPWNGRIDEVFVAAGALTRTEIQNLMGQPLSSQPSPQPDPEPEPEPADTASPAAPAGLQAEALCPWKPHRCLYVSLSWQPSTDDVGVAGYNVYRDGQLLARTLRPAHADTEVEAGRAYQYEVSAVDAAQNESARSTPASATSPLRVKVRLTLGPRDPEQALLSIRTNSSLFSDALHAVDVKLPSGVKSLAVGRLPEDPSVYYAKVEAALFQDEDFQGLGGAAAEVTIAAQTLPAQGERGTVVPELGGVVRDFADARVLLLPGDLTDDARIDFLPEPAADLARREEALRRQGLLSLGPGRDVSFVSAGQLYRAELDLPFDASLVDPDIGLERAQIAHFNETTGSWELLETRPEGGRLKAQVSHFSIYKPVLVLPSALPGLREAFVYPNPAVGPQTPTIRAFLGQVERLEVTIFDLSGEAVHSGQVAGGPTGIAGGEYYYDYPWTGGIASGVYFAVIHGVSGDATLRARAKFAVVR